MINDAMKIMMMKYEMIIKWVYYAYYILLLYEKICRDRDMDILYVE